MSYTLAEKYLPILDEVYKRNSLTSRLDVANNRVQFVGANSVKLYKTSLQGLGDYDRANGFVNGTATGSWETLTLAQDRGRSFTVDAMDNEETLGMAFGTLVGEFLRTSVVPEIDAYRFATYAGSAGTTVSGDISGISDLVPLIDAAEEAMGDAEVPREGNLLYISEAAYKVLKNDITRYVSNEGGINHNVEVYNGMEVIRVPKGRFNTAITLYDGTTVGEEAGGFIPTASTGYPINFMIVNPAAVIQVVKHAVPRIFSPAVNQTADGWKFDYRIYHDAFVEANKVKGIYLHKASTANA